MHQDKIFGNPTVVKLDGTNYNLWKYQMQPILANRKLLNVVTGSATELKPEEVTEKDFQAREIINSSLEPKVMKKVLTCGTARELWTQLKSHFDRDGVNFQSVDYSHVAQRLLEFH